MDTPGFSRVSARSQRDQEHRQSGENRKGGRPIRQHHPADERQRGRRVPGLHRRQGPDHVVCQRRLRADVSVEDLLSQHLQGQQGRRSLAVQLLPETEVPGTARDAGFRPGPPRGPWIPSVQVAARPRRQLDRRLR